MAHGFLLASTPQRCPSLGTPLPAPRCGSNAGLVTATAVVAWSHRGRRRLRQAVQRRVVAFGRRQLAKSSSRWAQAARCTPLQDDDPDGKLMRMVESMWLTRGLEITFGYLPREDRTRVFSALSVAALAHKGQKRKSGEPYLVHPVVVAELLASLKVATDVVIAGLLHDTVEDNPEITFQDLQDLFGKDVRRIVEAETKASKRTSLMRSEEGWSRVYSGLHRFVFGQAPRGSDTVISKAQEQAGNLRDLFLAMADDYQVILVKLADRLHNMRTLEFMPQQKRYQIALETMLVFAPLAHRLGVWMFKTELEDLSFKYLMPHEFQKIDNHFAERRAQYRWTLNSAAGDLQEAVRRDEKMKGQGVRVEITSREKGMYSLWRKLKRTPKYFGNLDNVTDIIALRVVLDIDRQPGESDKDFDERGNDLCYRALCLVYTLPGWAPAGAQPLISGRAPLQRGSCLKDYIEHPKPNGYRSLHTIIMNLSAPEVPLEVQIRTRQMHDVAEYGMAAHWAYKGEQLGGEAESPDVRSRRVAWLESIKYKDKEHGADPVQFVQDVLREELGKRCFVFMRSGRILNLSRGCTVLDAAFRIHTEVGLHMLYPEVNGGKVDPSYLLQNGDCVNIVTAPDAVPKLDWLDKPYLRSTRGLLISHFRQLERDKENKLNMINFAAGAATFFTGMAAATSVLEALLPS